MARDEFDLITMGRIGVDLYPLQAGVGLADVSSFGKFLGGSSTNVAVAAARLGLRTATVSRTGRDPFGDYLRSQLREFGVDERWVTPVDGLPTPVTFCEIFPPDDFPLYFYRRPSAPDLQIAADELDLDAIGSAGIFWMTGTGLSAEPSRGATLAALARRPGGGHTVFDLDWRPMFWSDPDAARPFYREALRHATVAVGNVDEVEIATGEREPVAAARALLSYGVRLAVVKQGPRGVLAMTSDGDSAEVPPLPVEVLNGLGAGDAFGGALCHGLLAGWDLARTMRYANAAGAIVASRLECSSAMPVPEEVEAALASGRVPVTADRAVPRAAPDDPPAVPTSAPGRAPVGADRAVPRAPGGASAVPVSESAHALPRAPGGASSDLVSESGRAAAVAGRAVPRAPGGALDHGAPVLQAPPAAARPGTDPNQASSAAARPGTDLNQAPPAIEERGPGRSPGGCGQGARAGDPGTLARLRAEHPEAVQEAATTRTRRNILPAPDTRLMIIAADHPARGALAAGDHPHAMAARTNLLERLRTALSRPGVDGVLASADVLDDLLLLGALENKVVIGSMNRGGLAGAAFELDDRFTGYRPEDLTRRRFDAGKLLLRIGYDEPGEGTVRTLESAARAVDAMAERRLPVFIEPFVSHRDPATGALRNDLSADAVTRSIAVASGLGGTSAYTWLKVPVVDDPDTMARVMETSTLPAVLLGGDIKDGDQDATYEKWRTALRLPTVQGLVVGRSLLYPPDGDVAAAVDTAVGLL